MCENKCLYWLRNKRKRHKKRWKTRNFFLWFSFGGHDCFHVTSLSQPFCHLTLSSLLAMDRWKEFLQVTFVEHMGCEFKVSFHIETLGKKRGCLIFYFYKNHCNISFVLNFSISLGIKIDFASSLQHFSVKKLIFWF